MVIPGSERDTFSRSKEGSLDETSAVAPSHEETVRLAQKRSGRLKAAATHPGAPGRSQSAPRSWITQGEARDELAPGNPTCFERASPERTRCSWNLRHDATLPERDDRGKREAECRLPRAFTRARPRRKPTTRDAQRKMVTPIVYVTGTCVHALPALTRAASCIILGCC